MVKRVSILDTKTLQPENQEARVKLSEVMKCSKSVESLHICLQGGITQLFALMVTSGWSSIQELVLSDDFHHVSLREAEHLSSFTIVSFKVRTSVLCAL